MAKYKHYVYRIYINDEVYVGSHSTKNINDNYFCSSPEVNKLRDAGLPYNRQILYFFDNVHDKFIFESVMIYKIGTLNKHKITNKNAYLKKVNYLLNKYPELNMFI